MKVIEKEIKIPVIEDHHNLRAYLHEQLSFRDEGIVIRCVITKTDDQYYYCDVGFLCETDGRSPNTSIFEINKRKGENTDKFNAVLVIPTGIGAVLGGHSGDGCALAKLMGTVCDTLITHPNVVNAADINEMTDNTLYVEGSIISRLLFGTIQLRKVRSNRVLVYAQHQDEAIFHEATVNSTSAARVTLGFNCSDVAVVKDSFTMSAEFAESGRATGMVDHLEKAEKVLEKYKGTYDAVAFSTPINVDDRLHLDYFTQDMDVNPWGGVEAMLTHSTSLLYNIPTAHAPMIESKDILELETGVVDPRKSAESVSMTYLHCVLKGLQRSPKIIETKVKEMASDISAEDISCLIIPQGCVGLPTLAALEQGIPVIAVKENTNRMQNNLEDLPFENNKFFLVNNYLEAIGVMQALKQGMNIDSVQRPIANTSVQEE